MLYRKDIDETKTIHKEDAELFHEIVNNNLFDKEDKDTGVITRYENKLELITDKAQIKKVLDEKYSSRSRTEEYTPGLPSATVISGGLFPMDIDYKDRGSQYNILRWWNNISIEDMNAQKVKNKLSTDSGTLIHLVLQNAFEDNCRAYNKKRKLNEYIQQACSSQEIIKMIDNFDNRKEYFIEMCQKSLQKFFNSEIEHIHPVFSELFINTGIIQGAIDLIGYSKGCLYIIDYKTSKKSKSRNSLYESYARQLYIYSRMLLSEGYITLKEYNSLSFKIIFINWESGNLFIHDYIKEEICKSKAYVDFIISWYYQIKNNDKDLKIEL